MRKWWRGRKLCKSHEMKSVIFPCCYQCPSVSGFSFVLCQKSFFIFILQLLFLSLKGFAVLQWLKLLVLFRTVWWAVLRPSSSHQLNIVRVCVYHYLPSPIQTINHGSQIKSSQVKKNKKRSNIWQIMLHLSFLRLHLAASRISASLFSCLLCRSVWGPRWLNPLSHIHYHNTIQLCPQDYSHVESSSYLLTVGSLYAACLCPGGQGLGSINTK